MRGYSRYGGYLQNANTAGIAVKLRCSAVTGLLSTSSLAILTVFWPLSWTEFSKIGPSVLQGPHQLITRQRERVGIKVRKK